MRTIKQRLANGETLNVFGSGRTFHPNILQLIGLSEQFQGVWFDLEHTALTISQVEIGTAILRGFGLDSFCRLAPTDYASVTRCYEAGAGGVMAAQITSAKQAEEFVRWTKFVPRGERGLNTGGWDGQFGRLAAKPFCERADREGFVAIQIETLGALHEAESIAAIDGVDCLFVGPVDLSQHLGVTGDFFHPKCVEALAHVSACAQRHGKSWASVAANPQHAELLLSKGCRMLSPANEVRVLWAGLQAMAAEFPMLFKAV